MIVVIGRVQTSAEQRDSLVQTAQAMCAASRSEPGCAGYRFYEDTEQPNHFVFVEEWESEDGLQTHFGQAHTSEFMATIRGLVVGPPDASFHTVASTRRLGARGLVDQ